MNREFENENGYDQGRPNGAGRSRRRPVDGETVRSAGEPGTGAYGERRPAGQAGQAGPMYGAARRTGAGGQEPGVRRTTVDGRPQGQMGQTARRPLAAGTGNGANGASSANGFNGSVGGAARRPLNGNGGGAMGNGGSGSVRRSAAAGQAAGAAGAGAGAGGVRRPAEAGQAAGANGARRPLAGQAPGGAGVNGVRRPASSGQMAGEARPGGAGAGSVRRAGAAATGQAMDGAGVSGARRMSAATATGQAAGEAGGNGARRNPAASGQSAVGAGSGVGAGAGASGARRNPSAAGQPVNGAAGASRRQAAGAGAAAGTSRAAGTAGRAAAGANGARVAGSTASGAERPRFRGELGNSAEAGAQAARRGKGNDGAGGNGGDRPGSRGAGGSGDGGKSDPKKTKPHFWRIVIILLIIFEILIMVLIGGFRYAFNKYNSIRRDPNINMNEMTNPNIQFDKVESMKGYWTIALFGVDSRNNSLGKGNNADVNIICNVNMDSGEIKLVSVFRDSYLNIDDKGSYNKINQAYFLGGPKQAIEALNKNLDLEIDDYATFNWKAVIDAINILGGVDIELSKAEFYYINAFITETVQATGVGSVQLTHAGMNHLDGVQAVAYARLRKMDTDFARTERQRKVIQLAFDKLKKADFAVVNNVMEVVLAQVETSVTIDDLIPAAKGLTKYYIGETTGFPQARGDANMGKKGECVIPQTLESNVVLLHQFLFDDEGYQPSDMVKKISSKIAADTGLYKEGKPVDHVGTDGGYIPKPTQPKATTAAQTEETDENKETTAPIDGSVIDGENEGDLELETDEFGNVIDPPESEGHFYPGGNTTRPGDESSTHTGDGTSAYPGGGTSAYPGGGTSAYPGGGTSPYPGGGTSAYPGGGTSPYPGGGTSGYPGESTSSYPGGGSYKPSSPDDVRNPTSATRPSSPGSPTSSPSPDDVSGPGVTAAPSTAHSNGNSPGEPTIQSRTSAADPDNNSGGPDSVITGPGGN